jgi:hypothetical protein
VHFALYVPGSSLRAAFGGDKNLGYGKHAAYLSGGTNYPMKQALYMSWQGWIEESISTRENAWSEQE